MIESKSVKCSTYDENSVIEIWQDFGWSLKSSQEINNTDSHLEQRIDGVYSVTTKENYVKLTFERDTNIKNHSELVSLQNSFNSYEAMIQKEKEIPSLGILCFILLLPPLTPLGAIILFFKIIKKASAKKYNKKIAPKNKEIWDKKYQIRSKARGLLN